MEENQTKVCSKCGNRLPISEFSKGNGADGLRSWCKNCMSKATKEYRERKKLAPVANPLLKDFTPQELITELRARGYTGSLTFEEVKVHHIKL